ncbi:MAG: hypothetical protein AB7L36_16345 [Sphingomonadaceae bacterium]
MATMTRKAAFALAASLLLHGCGASDDAGVGGVTAGEAQALNEAAAMLDERAANVQQALEVENGAE